MSNPSEATLPRGDSGGDDVDQRRRKLLLATCIAGGAATGATAWPFLASMEPSERAKALGAPVEVDVSALAPGEQMIVEWQGKPVWIVRRTKEMLATLDKDAARLADPASKRSEQPDYARNEWRARADHKDLLVVVGICTHLGCSPTYRPEVAPADLGSDWLGGFFCPCHQSKFDLAGRVFKGVPAPTNLVVPPYRYATDTQIVIGEDTKA
jgi:ubiquinol-cytochrome c reductase iron-sulfur subunit